MTTRSSRPPAMVDVAARAGVSYQTVSRVVNGHPSVAADTRARVQAAIEELQFRPNIAARALVTGRGSTIAVFASNTTLFGYAGTLEGIEHAARAAGLTVMITVLDQALPLVVGTAVERALEQQPAGVICLTHDSVGREALDLVPADLPAVGVGGVAGPHRSHAVMQEQVGAAQATAHLLELGHRTVHHVAIPNDRGPSPRSAGWQQALESAGRRVPAVVQASWLPRSGYQAGLRLGRRRGVTAVLAGNDDLAIGVIRGLSDSGLRVPEDVSVIGFDDQPFTEFMRPALTTVQQRFPELGRTAVDLLQRAIDRPGSGATPDQVEATRNEAGGNEVAWVPTALVLRESTAAPGSGAPKSTAKTTAKTTPKRAAAGQRPTGSRSSTKPPVRPG